MLDDKIAQTDGIGIILLDLHAIKNDDNSTYALNTKKIVNCNDLSVGQKTSNGYLVVDNTLLRDEITNSLNNTELKVCTSHVTDMSNLFRDIKVSSPYYYIGGLKVNLSNWDTSNVTDMSYMFKQNYWEAPDDNLINREFLPDITNWNISNVTSHDYFNYISILEDSNCSIFP